MLQIPSHLFFTNGHSYQQLADAYLHGTISPESLSPQILYRLPQLSGAINTNDEKFFFVTDIKSGGITHCSGIGHCLGYTDSHFTQKNYLRIIHPAHAVVQGFYAAALFRLLSRYSASANPEQPLCSSALALRSKAGNYLYCKRRCFPIQLTPNNRIVASLCEFTVIKSYTNEDYHTRLYDAAFSTAGANEQLQVLVKQVFRETAGAFSVQELRILKRYTLDESAGSNSIAKAFKIGKATVSTYNKRIMQKTETLFAKRVSSARDAAAYFKNIQLI